MGLTSKGNQLWHQDSAGVGGEQGADDEFGRALACGDVDGNGCDDLAIGEPWEDFGADANAEA